MLYGQYRRSGLTWTESTPNGACPERSRRKLRTMNNELLTSIENPTLAHFSHFSSLFTNPNRRNAPNSAATPNKPPIWPKLSTNYAAIITNKANFPRAQDDIRYTTYAIRNKFVAKFYSVPSAVKKSTKSAHT